MVLGNKCDNDHVMSRMRDAATKPKNRVMMCNLIGEGTCLYMLLDWQDIMGYLTIPAIKFNTPPVFKCCGCF